MFWPMGLNVVYSLVVELSWSHLSLQSPRGNVSRFPTSLGVPPKSRLQRLVLDQSRTFGKISDLVCHQKRNLVYSGTLPQQFSQKENRINLIFPDLLEDNFVKLKCHKHNTQDQGVSNRQHLKSCQNVQHQRQSKE